jgi:DNA-binding NarL/FixJ family response regulator
MQSSRRSTTTPQVIARAIEDSASGVAEGTRDSLPDPAGIALIDDDWDALSRLREVIEQDPDLAVVAACRCAAGAMLAVERYRPAVLILDVRLPDRDGVELIRDIVAASDAKVIVFTAAAQKAEIIRALRNGARAVVFKTQPASLLISCIRKVLAGELGPIPWQLAKSERQRANGSGALEVLSPREREVAQLAATGARNKEISWQLGISEGTVKLHLFHAFQKLRVGNRVGLVLALRKTANDIVTGITLVSLTFV